MIWQKIETAPKETEVLVYREDAGVVMGKLTSLSEILSDREIEDSDYSEDSLFCEDWFCGDFSNSERWEGDEKPTHWMPLPDGPR